MRGKRSRPTRRANIVRGKRILGVVAVVLLASFVGVLAADAINTPRVPPRSGWYNRSSVVPQVERSMVMPRPADPASPNGIPMAKSGPVSQVSTESAKGGTPSAGGALMTPRGGAMYTPKMRADREIKRLISRLD
jgi:hypothetical protein